MGSTGNERMKSYVRGKTIDGLLSANKKVKTIIDLLYNKAEKANEIISNFEPILTKEDYLELMDDVDTKEYSS